LIAESDQPVSQPEVGQLHGGGEPRRGRRHHSGATEAVLPGTVFLLPGTRTRFSKPISVPRLPGLMVSSLPATEETGEMGREIESCQGTGL
jgi:hypothetical protein